MTKITTHQAHLWSHQIMTEATKRLKEKNDPFDAMLFIESKEVRGVLPSIIDSLSNKHAEGLDNKHDNMHHSDAITCLMKAMRKTYGKADNPILQCLKERGNEQLKDDFAKSEAMFDRLAASKSDASELALSR